jgi:hypothetical protein
MRDISLSTNRQINKIDDIPYFHDKKSVVPCTIPTRYAYIYLPLPKILATVWEKEISMMSMRRFIYFSAGDGGEIQLRPFSTFGKRGLFIRYTRILILIKGVQVWDFDLLDSCDFLT